MEPAGDPQVRYDPYNDLSRTSGSEAFERLFKAESDFMVPPSYLNDEVKKALRRTAVAIIEEQSLTGKFDALIPYTAMTYFDRYFSKFNRFPTVTASRRGSDEHLFAICCLTLAWKLRMKSFALPVFLRNRSLQYSTQEVRHMELEICRGLEWRMRTLTPFRFVEFFIPILSLPPNSPSPRPLVRYLIIRSQYDIAFTEFRPSVMAATAVLIVSSKMFPDQHPVSDLKITTDIEPLRLLKDMILNCTQQLAPLYRNPPIRKPKDASIEVEPARTKPIWIPGHEPPPTPSTPRQMSESLFWASLPPGSNVEQRLLEWEEIKRQEAAKAAAAADQLMDFEMGWKELLDAAETRERADRLNARTSIVPRLNNCCFQFAIIYDNVKNSTGGYCNIL
ncbi:hypothetical protein OROMI_019968 [Orobanche minor]